MTGMKFTRTGYERSPHPLSLNYPFQWVARPCRRDRLLIQRSPANAPSKPTKKPVAARASSRPNQQRQGDTDTNGSPYNISAPTDNVDLGIDISTLSFTEQSAALRESDSRARTSPLSLVKTPASVLWPQPERAAQEPQQSSGSRPIRQRPLSRLYRSRRSSCASETAMRTASAINRAAASGPRHVTKMRVPETTLPLE